ncbi:MAG: Fur family transcriptional regulator [Acidimicrobiia bacterium]
MTADLDRAVAMRLQLVGQRYTPNRQQLVAALEAEGQPLTIPEILRRRPDLAQSSVYRNLVVLEQAAVVTKVVTSSEWGRYELAEDLTGRHHHHVICSGCGLVRDVELPGKLERSIDGLLASVALDTGFVIEEHRLDLVGRCKECA